MATPVLTVIVGRRIPSSWIEAVAPFKESLQIAQAARTRSSRREQGSPLVHRLANNGDVAGGQLAVFQGASEAPISESYGSSEQRGKTANWPRPGGLR
jgi:hypothetical protein